MIYSENSKPSLQAFRDLMKKTDSFLNHDAQNREDYYCHQNGKLLEEDVFQAMDRCAFGTPFQGSIQLVSGAFFPDIVAGNFFGVEVKSTEKNRWTSTGSSILESTRIPNIERIFLTFGKLGKPVQFLSRPYEECMADIAVTHYPRYKIDMRLKPGETIFDKIGISYEKLRIMENPVVPVSQYYKAHLKDGESLWWASGNLREENSLPPTVRLWTTLSADKKEQYKVHGCVLFPEVFNSHYDRYALWLATQNGIINTSVRDSFSSGGQVTMHLAKGIEIKMPAVFGRIKKYSKLIVELINECDETTLMEYWQVDNIEKDRIKQWCQLVAKVTSTSIDPNTTWKVLCDIFS